MTTADEAALAAALQSGDAAAFEQLFLAHYTWLARVAFRYVKQVDTAEDIAQDVFLQLWHQRQHVDPARSLRAWLVANARNRALNLLAHDDVIRRHAEYLQNDEEHSTRVATPSAEDVILADELAQVAAARVAQLSPRLREIYQLSRVEGLTPAEIGDVLGIATQTVYVQMGKILRALYPVLEPWMEDRGQAGPK